MEHYHKHSDLLDGIKDRIKDGEYKMLMESLSKIRNIKKEVYVKVIRISAVTHIYHETKEDGDECIETESLISEIDNGSGWRYSMCNQRCECGECRTDPLKTIEVTTKMKKQTLLMKVDEDREYYVTTEVIGRQNFERLKRDKTLTTGVGDILVYLEDNE